MLLLVYTTFNTKLQISQHQLRNLAFSFAQLKRPLVVYFLLISLLKHNIIQSVTVYEGHFVIAFKSGIEMEI